MFVAAAVIVQRWRSQTVQNRVDNNHTAEMPTL